MLVERMVRLVGADEVAHQQRDAVFLRANARGQGRRLVDRDAQSVHSGVDMQRGAAAPFIGCTESIPFGEFDQTSDHRTRLNVGKGGRRSRQQTVEHVDCRLRHDRAYATRFGQIGDEKRLAPGGCEHARYRLDAAAIAVGLDDGGAFRRHRASAPVRTSWLRPRRDQS